MWVNPNNGEILLEQEDTSAGLDAVINPILWQHQPEVSKLMQLIVNYIIPCKWTMHVRSANMKLRHLDFLVD